MIKTKLKKTRYAKNTAGSLMTDKFPIVNLQARVKDVTKLLRASAEAYETIGYIYIVDRKNVLRGVMSVKELFRSRGDLRVKKFIQKKLFYVYAHTDQERMVYLAIQHRIKSVPVVDSKKRIIGVVPPHLLLDVMKREAEENLMRIGGIADGQEKFDDIMKMSAWQSLRHRLPWLVVGLFGGVLASLIIGHFENILSKHLILAAFIPLIVYISGAVGAQMVSYIIRDLAVRQNLPFAAYCWRHGRIVVLLSTFLSLILYLFLMLFYGQPMVAAVISISLFIASVSSILTGLLVPFAFSRMNMDPANASGPIATIIQDLMGVMIYFGIGTLLLA